MRARSRAPSPPIISTRNGRRFPAAPRRRLGQGAGDGIGVDDLAPRWASIRATVLLPLPMPPVRPMRRPDSLADPAQHPVQPRQHHDQTAGQEGPKGT
jgi:hypothetical protein